MRRIWRPVRPERAPRVLISVWLIALYLAFIYLMLER